MGFTGTSFLHLLQSPSSLRCFNFYPLRKCFPSLDFFWFWVWSIFWMLPTIFLLPFFSPWKKKCFIIDVKHVKFKDKDIILPDSHLILLLLTFLSFIYKKSLSIGFVSNWIDSVYIWSTKERFHLYESWRILWKYR